MSVFALAAVLDFMSNPLALPFLLLFGLTKFGAEPIRARQDAIIAISTGKESTEGLYILGRSLGAEATVSVTGTTSTNSISLDTISPTPLGITPTPTTMLVLHRVATSVCKPNEGADPTIYSWQCNTTKGSQILLLLRFVYWYMFLRSAYCVSGIERVFRRRICNGH